MLRLRDGQAIVWEELLPEQVRLLSPELEAIDQLLDHERFLQPFIERFWCPVGRPTIPIESYLRLMYLKHRYGLGYETLCREVSDSISWRCFCRIALDKRVPHPTTLSKLTRRFGPEIIEDLNRALLERAVEGKLIRAGAFGWTPPASRPTCAIRPTRGCARTPSAAWGGRCARSSWRDWPPARPFATGAARPGRPFAGSRARWLEAATAARR